MKKFDAIILGAGPYGLATAAQLRKRGLNIAVFGKPMSLWQDHMPKGELLRSRWWDTSFSDDAYSIKEYFKYLRQKPIDPLPHTTLIAYAKWFQEHAIGNIDETYITSIKKHDACFFITLADGREVTSKHVIMAPGLGYYVYVPEAYREFPKKFVSHTYDNYFFDTFKNKRVAIVGGGQSALENAALMSEAGIDVHLIHRSPINWLKPPNNKILWEKIRYPKAAVSDGWDNWLLEHTPYTFHKLPRKTKDNYLHGKGKNGPAAAHWLIPRMQNVKLHKEKTVEKIRPTNSHITLTLSNNKTLDVDHIVFATGYKADVKKLTMLDNAILNNITTYKGYPVLNHHFESNIPGLYFTGYTAHNSFGPLYRFVAGTSATGKRLANAIKK